MKLKLFFSISALLASTVIGSYVLLKHTSLLSIAPSKAVTPVSVTETNTQIFASTTQPETTTEQMSPTMARLLKLINDCQVEAINFDYTHVRPSKSIESITLKNGNLFDGPRMITENDLPTLHEVLFKIRDKCHVNVSMPPGGDQ